MFDKSYIDRLFSLNPAISSILRAAENPQAAEDALLNYANELLNSLHRGKQKSHPLEWELQMNCTRAFQRIMSPRSRQITNCNLTELLWVLANGKKGELPSDISNGFFEEIIHLFLGMQGKSKIYDHNSRPEYMDYEGRKAALLRSEQLDQMAKHADEYIRRYRSGLDEEIQRIRAENRNRILGYFKATADDWNNYQWQLTHIVRDAEVLGALITLTAEESQAISLAQKGKLPFGITPYYASLMDNEPGRQRDYAVRAQVIPPREYVDAMLAQADDVSSTCDFMLERDTSPLDLITRRYPNIAILKPYNTCSQICVYCQRNWEIDDVLFPDALASREKIDEAIDWISRHPALTEILITGGDPLVMDNENIDYVISRLAAIDHIERIRIGSRTPVVLPQRLTDELMDIISAHHQPGRREVVLVTHFEHPYEITPESMEAVQQFKRRGISIYNQTVYTVENSRRFELVALRRLLRLIGVDPYYTFNTKGKEETGNYRVPLARIQQEATEEARLATGVIRTDEPVYNVPALGKNYLKAQQHHSLLTILPNGKRVYEFHPWEKNISLVDTYVDTDVSIYDYLKQLESRGEKLEDYKTIWYYF